MNPDNTHQAEAVAAVESGDTNTSVVKALIDNSIHSGWTPAYGSAIRLCHGDADTVVSPAGAAAAAASLPNSTLVALDSGVCTSHSDCGMACMIDSLEQLALFVSRSDPRGEAPEVAAQSGTCTRTCRRGNRPL